jgi:N6-L-threonylcarbamoyladenine synthase
VKILAIETSCDETGIALVEANPPVRLPVQIGPHMRTGAGKPASGMFKGGLPRFRIAKSLIASQIKIHRPFGGVVPSLAKREHNRNLPILLNKLINSSNAKFKNQKSKIQTKSEKFFKDIDLLTVTVGPGLEPALWAGITFAEELAKKYKKPLAGANHLEGHLYSFLLAQKTISAKRKAQSAKLFPAVALIVSGGHTILLKMSDLYTWEKIGETRDDALGEAYDKVARLLGLPYPGGPEVEKLARKGNPQAIDFPRPMIYHKNYDFSFSGLKTSVRYYVVTHPAADKDEKTKADIAASFQEAALDVLIRKTARAIEEIGAKTLFVSGGVSINSALRERFKQEFGKKIRLYFPNHKFCNDNAAMIAAAAYIKFIQGKKYRPAAQANLNM